jgi:Predicted Rossmann fold nucleotide-binding protein involved in DNA uptake
MSISYAGIGSRQTPINVLNLMKQLAEVLAIKGETLRSGAADGADAAFEAGCLHAGGQAEIYLPWPGFNGHKSPLAYPHPDAFTLAARFHPAWNQCKQGARALHARNCHQVLGRNLDDPVSKVICWTPNGSGSGGTGQALRLAKHLNIPIYDLGNPIVANDAQIEVATFLFNRSQQP